MARQKITLSLIENNKCIERRWRRRKTESEKAPLGYSGHSRAKRPLQRPTSMAHDFQLLRSEKKFAFVILPE